MSDTTSIIKRIERAALKTLGDDGRYKCRFEIRSGTSDRVYRISFDAAPGAGYWKCSCMGNIRHGKCKHLTAMGLPGRKTGKSLKWVNHFGLGYDG